MNTWEEARKYCANIGGNLASIPTRRVQGLFCWFSIYFYGVHKYTYHLYNLKRVKNKSQNYFELSFIFFGQAKPSSSSFFSLPWTVWMYCQCESVLETFVKTGREKKRCKLFNLYLILLTFSIFDNQDGWSRRKRLVDWSE